MKKPTLLFLFCCFALSCQTIFNNSVVGTYTNSSGTETIEFTPTKCIGGYIISSYKVEDGYIYLDGELGQITRFQIIDKNTIKLITANDTTDAETLYRVGSQKAVKHISTKYNKTLHPVKRKKKVDTTWYDDAMIIKNN